MNNFTNKIYSAAEGAAGLASFDSQTSVVWLTLKCVNQTPHYVSDN
jgi:hypothetical protein